MTEYMFTARHFGGLHAAECQTCRALVLMGNEEAHSEWHDRLRATLMPGPFSGAAAGLAALNETSDGV